MTPQEDQSRRRGLARTALVCLTLAIPAASLGQPQPRPRTPQDLKRLSIEELAEVEVSTASRRPERLAQAAAAVSILRYDDIRRSGATTLAEAMRIADGVDVARSDARTWAISARGFNITTANKLLVMIDGRTVYSPLFSGTFWDVQDTLFMDIDRIEVVRGPGGSIWGANAVNGVVNVITKEAAATRGTAVFLGSGTDERLIASARHGGAVSGGGSYRVYGKYRHRVAQQTTSGASANDEIDFGQGGFRIESRPDGRVRWFVQGDLYGGSEGQLTGADTEVTGANVLGRWTRPVGAARFQAQAYYDRTTRNVPAQFDETRHTFEIDTQHRMTIGQRHALVSGAAFRVTHARDRGSAVLFFSPEERTDGLFSVFLQDEIALRQGSTFLTVGSKFERSDLAGLEIQPTVRLRWSRGGSETLWAAISRAVRLPTRFDTDLRIAAAPLVIEGSESFRSEEIVAYEAGYRALPHPRLSFDVAMFANRYDDLRSLEQPLTSGDPVILGNMLNAVTSGIEVAVTAQVLSRVRVHGSYAFLHKDLSLDPGSRDVSGGTSEGNDPTHRFTMRTQVDLPRALELDGILRSISARPSPAVPEYTELDLRFGWNVRPTLELSIVGQNLLHDQHREFGAAGPSRVLVQRGVYARSIWRF
jgi:iron complex outermembrane recepter protein